MIKWTKIAGELWATINGRDYLITKVGRFYALRCDGVLIGNDYIALINAKVAADLHAAAPAQPKPGIHMDAIQGQWMVDDLKRSFTTAQIQDFIDASPFDEPDTGAPEGGPLG